MERLITLITHDDFILVTLPSADLAFCVCGRLFPFDGDLVNTEKDVEPRERRGFVHELTPSHDPL